MLRPSCAAFGHGSRGDQHVFRYVLEYVAAEHAVFSPYKCVNCRALVRGRSDLSSRKIKRCCRRAVKLKFVWIARYPFPQRPTKTHFYERQRPTAVPSPFGLRFPWLFRLIRVRTSSDRQLPVGTQEFFLSSRRIAPYSRFRPIQTNSTAFRIIASDTSQYSAVVPIFRCPISF